MVAFAAALSVYLMTLARYPISSSQAIVGAIVGMGLLKSGHNISWRTVGGIAGSWVTTPFFAGLVSFILLFFVQNVFQLTVFLP